MVSKRTVSLKVNLENLLQYIFAFVVILYGQTVWIRINYIGGIYARLSFVLAFIVVMLILCQRYYSRDAIVLALALALLLGIYFLLSRYNVMLVLRVGLLLCLLIIYLWSLYDRGGVFEFIKKYSDIVIVISFVSVALYIFGTILHIVPSQTVTYFWAGQTKSCTTYFNLMYEAQVEEFYGIEFNLLETVEYFVRLRVMLLLCLLHYS